MTKFTRRSAKSCVFLGASVLAMATSTQAAAQSCADDDAPVCEITIEEGTVGADVTIDSRAHIINNGTDTWITQTDFVPIIVENKAGASIANIQRNTGTYDDRSLDQATIINSGVINRDLSFLSGGIYVNDGGTVTGNVTSQDLDLAYSTPGFGSTSQIFVNRGALGETGIQGILDPGNGLDAYVQSYSSDATHTLPAALPTNFELNGVEAFGVDTTVTIAANSTNPATRGLALMGDGIIINNANINPHSLLGTGYDDFTAAGAITPAITYHGVPGKSLAYRIVRYSPAGQRTTIPLAHGAALTAFTNTGAINGNIILNTANFENSGTITARIDGIGTLIHGATDTDFSFTNSGTISLADIFIYPQIHTTYLDGFAIGLVNAIDAGEAKAVTIANSGELGGGLAFRGAASDFLFENSGAVHADGNYLIGHTVVDLSIGQPRFTTVESFKDGIAADSVVVENKSSGVIAGSIRITGNTKTFSFSNEGMIGRDEGYAYQQAINVDLGHHVMENGEEIDLQLTESIINNSGNIVGRSDFDISSQYILFNNSGNIKQVGRGDDHWSANENLAVKIEQETNSSASLVFENDGAILSEDYASSAVDLHIKSGDIYDDVEGDIPVDGMIEIRNSGNISSTGGNYLVYIPEYDPISYDIISYNTEIEFAVALTAIVHATGSSSVSVTNEVGGVISAMGQSHIGGDYYFEPRPINFTGGGIAVAASADKVTIVNHGTILGGRAFGLDYSVRVGGVSVPGQYIPITGYEFDAEGIVGGAIDTIQSVDDITNSATGVIQGGIALRQGDDILRNYGSITDYIDMGSGDDTFVQGIGATLVRAALGGAGTDRFLIDITGDGVVDNAIFQQALEFESFGLTGTGSVVLNGVLPFETIELIGGMPIEIAEGSVVETLGPVTITGSDANDVLSVLGTVNGAIDLGGGANHLTVGGTVNGDVAFGDGDDVLLADGTINGDVALGGGANRALIGGVLNGNLSAGDGADLLVLEGTVDGDVSLDGGDDTLTLYPGWAITGTTSGDDGFDQINALMDGTYAEPTPLDLAGFEAFEQLNVGGTGVGAIGGIASYDTINVDSGRLIGLAGSTIAANVNVAAGATFGSAGTVTGDVVVHGTLSPGASPGTMTVNGDVTLASGSTTVFEMTPTISDALVINGGLTIADNTTLNITGERPLTPGVTYNLITTTDGITGSFTTTNKAATVLGFLRQTANALELLGTFQMRDGMNAQAATTGAYFNTLLLNGEASDGLLDAVGDLIDADGYASEAVFSTLHPEAYASASQIGVENGLAISSALRTASWAGRGSEAGLFTFGQGFGTWRNFANDRTSGVSEADVRSNGFFGGVGYGTENLSASVFVGRVDGQQEIDALGAKNDADGTFFGAKAELALGGFELGAAVIRDHSSVDTSRTLFNGADVASHYRLRSTTADIHARYGFAIGGGWNVGPEIGVTHVKTKRGEAIETTGGAFNLNVAENSTSYTFMSADLSLQMSEGVLRPWLSAGLRQRLDNDHAEATASLAGTTSSFTVDGVQRDSSFANVGAGVTWQATPALRLFARGNSEFGNDNNAQSVDAGLRWQF